MDTDRAYLLGLVIGGGDFGFDGETLRIRLPYKKWGSYIGNPQRAGHIGGDIMRKVGQMFRAVYGLSVQYETTPGGIWTILPEGDLTALKTDLESCGIACEGELSACADISGLISRLADDNLKRRFAAGLADTIGSVARSHRRFSDEHQILSFEIKGYNFRLVCQLCHLLYSINCVPDQINWNHPNIHCTADPYYRQWNKGFKLRVLMDQYARFGAFAFRTKAEAQNENRHLQLRTHTAARCEERGISVTPSCVHPAECDPRLPEAIRGGHYIHFRHFCAVLGCEHAPYDKLDACFEHLGENICPFPILCKDSLEHIEAVISADPLLARRTYTRENISLARLLAAYDSNTSGLIYGDAAGSGYPIARVLHAAAYAAADESELSGKRPRGSYVQVIKNHLARDPEASVELRRPDLLTPLVIAANGRGALVGAANPAVYARLVERDPGNEYKLRVRAITEEDLHARAAQ